MKKHLKMCLPLLLMGRPVLLGAMKGFFVNTSFIEDCKF